MDKWTPTFTAITAGVGALTAVAVALAAVWRKLRAIHKEEAGIQLTVDKLYEALVEQSRTTRDLRRAARWQGLDDTFGEGAGDESDDN